MFEIIVILDDFKFEVVYQIFTENLHFGNIT